MKNRSSLGVILTRGLTEAVTPWAGATLLVELYRKAGVEAAAERALPKKKSPKGLRQGQMMERPLQGSFAHPESAALAGLKEPSRQVIWTYVDKIKPGWQVTLDVDAQLVETTKENARYCYEGYLAFQPMEEEWAETSLVLADELRERNVPPGRGIKGIVDEAYNMLPPRPW